MQTHQRLIFSLWKNGDSLCRRNHSVVPIGYLATSGFNIKEFNNFLTFLTLHCRHGKKKINVIIAEIEMALISKNISNQTIFFCFAMYSDQNSMAYTR